MKRVIRSIAATAAALSFAGLACAQNPPGTASGSSASQPSPSEQSMPAQQPGGQAMPSEQPTPSPSTPATPSAGESAQATPDQSNQSAPHSAQSTPEGAAPGATGRDVARSSDQSNGAAPDQANQSAPDQSSQGVGPSPGTSRSGGMRLAAIVPAGMTAQEACTGFESVTDCATALHAAQNLNLPFADLKARLTGGQQLGAAIKELRPETDAQTEVRRAREQAQVDLGVPQG